MQALPTLVITGASSGIGHALATHAMKLLDSYRVILTSRAGSQGNLRAAFPDPRIAIMPLDLASVTSCSSFMENVRMEYGGVDILINNAGVSYRSVVEHITTDEATLQMQVNFLSPLHLIRLALPYMRHRHHGRIINISSVGGMMAMPTMGIYSASKFALEGLSESLWYEMRPWGIHVTLVQPGFVNSDSYMNVVHTTCADDAIHGKLTYYNYYHHMSRFIENLMRKSTTTPDDVARKVMRLLHDRHPPLRVPVGFDAHFFAWLRRILPRGIYHRLLYRLLPGIHRWGTGHRSD